MSSFARIVACALFALLTSAFAQAQDGWLLQDIGAASSPGSSVYDAATGAFTVGGSGAGVGGYSDSFLFSYQVLSGDGQITARISGWQTAGTAATAGLMIRESLTRDARHATVFLTGAGQVNFQSRLTPGANSTLGTAAAAAAPVWLRVVRSGTAITGYRSADGLVWTSVGSATVAFGAKTFIGMAVSSGAATAASAVFDNVSVPWANQDVGTVGVAGSAQFAGATGTYTVKGAGADIGSSADAFHFEYQRLTGNGEIIARVASIQNTNTAAKAGVMIRETLAPGSISAFMGVTPGSGAAYVYRATTGGTSKTVSATGVTAPVWVKLTRNGNTIAGFRSADGLAWTQVSSQTITMAASVYVGLAVVSKSTTALCTGTFTNVTFIRPWLHQDLGTTGLAGRLSFAEITGAYSIEGAGSDIGGATDSFHYAYQAQTGDGQVVARIASQQNTNASAKAGVMFRGALTATAANVSLLVTPAGGLLFQVRSADAGATTAPVTVAGVTAPVWLKLSRSGNVFSAYRSADGNAWTLVGTQTVALASAAFAGVADTSRSTTALSRVDYDGVSIGPVDSDNDGLPDSFETASFGNLAQTGSGDFDGDGYTNLQEYYGNSSPNDYFNGGAPQLAIASGDNQTGSPGVYLPQPLVVQVKTAAGQVVANASVAWSVVSGGGQLSATSGGALSSSVSVLTDANGFATAYYKSPTTSATSSDVRASVGSALATFHESTSGTVAAVTLSPDGGTFATQRRVTATCATPGAILRYTLNGADPTASDPGVASGETILVPTTATLKVRGFKNGWTDGDVKASSFILTGAISGGYTHSLALKIDGTVYAWGSNESGQLGNGTTDPEVVPATFPPTYDAQQITPAPVQGISDVVMIAAGAWASSALKADGTVWQWGGQTLLPAKVADLAGVTLIASGSAGTLALKSDGTLWKVGAPSTQIALTGVKAMAVGDGHYAALKTDGTVWCWGTNTDGQLGNGRTRDSASPVQVTGLTNVTGIACGYYHTMAVKADGTVWTWGNNQDGQLGDGTNVAKSAPVQVSGLTGMTRVSAGRYYSMALKSDGTVWTWGINAWGHLGAGYDDFKIATPVQFEVYPNDVIAISAGGEHSMSLRSDGTVWSAGYNKYGQLGNGYKYQAEYYPDRAVGFTVFPQAAAPQFTLQSQAQGAASILVTSTTRGAEIHYTVNGDEPTQSDPAVPANGVVSLPLPGTLKARAWFPYMEPSAVTSNFYDTDSDLDGLSDSQELALGTNPRKADSDGDGQSDSYEIAHGTDPRVNNGFNDPDGDGFTNAEEAILGTDPNVNNLPGGGSGAILLFTPLE